MSLVLAFLTHFWTNPFFLALPESSLCFPPVPFLSLPLPYTPPTHSYVGNLKEVPAIEWRNRAPERVLLHAVRGMIPKTKHKLNQMARLKVYPGPEHPFQAMFPNHPVSLEQVQAQTVALTDTWDFPADFPEDIKRKVLSRVEYKVDSRLIPQLKLVTKQYE